MAARKHALRTVASSRAEPPPAQGERPAASVAELRDALERIHAELLQLERQFGERLAEIHPTHRSSARNLIHYLALRRHDIRELQEQLASLGLSSLGRTESHVPPASKRSCGSLNHLAAREPRLGRAGERRGRLRRRHGAPARPHRGAARAAPGGARRAHHGDDAERGGARLPPGPPARRERHGLHAHQLRARRRGRVGGDGGESPSGRAGAAAATAASLMDLAGRSCAPARSTRARRS